MAAAVEFAEEPRGWLIFTGPSGSGKTHLAVAIASRCIERDQTTFFIVAADLLDHLRAAYSPENAVTYDDLFDQVRNVPLLIIDDLSTQSATPWAQEKLFQIFNHRFSAQLPTVITVRGPLERLEEGLPDLIVLDLMMPEMDGFEFLSHVGKNEAWRMVPVVVMTAKKLTAKDRKRLEGGADLLLEKGQEDLETLLTLLK